MVNKKIIFVISIFCEISTNTVSVVQLTNYPQFCLHAATDESLFKVFRNHEMCRAIVETVTHEQGKAFAAIIREKYPDLLAFCKKICRQDKFGAPLQFRFSGIGMCSPNVIRYLKIVGDLRYYFPDLGTLSIIEIGGGFGGQCKILADTYGFRSYTIIDLPECTPLIRKFLKKFNIQNTTTVNCNELNTMESDLLISNYAISEIDRAGQLEYFEKVINHASRGYIIYNNMPGVKPLSLEEFSKKLLKVGRKVIIERETPPTADDNFTIIWWPE